MKTVILYRQRDFADLSRLSCQLHDLVSDACVGRIGILLENDYLIRNELQRAIFFAKHPEYEYVCVETGRMFLTSQCVRYILDHGLPLETKALAAALEESPYAPCLHAESLCLHREGEVNWWQVATSQTALFVCLPSGKEGAQLKEWTDRYLLGVSRLGISENGSWKDCTLFGHWYDNGLAKGLKELLACMGACTVGDFGCGPGWYVAYLRKQGYDADGYDGNPYVEEISSTFFSDGYYCRQADLTEELETDEPFDVVLCLEVGEHIPSRWEETLIRNLARNSRKHVILSWALEGQNGDGHVNCHSNEYVASRMKRYGYVINRPASNYLRKCATLEWFKHTLMCFDRIDNIAIPRLPEVSVIVPGYNAEKYLDLCLDSLRKQTLQNIEIVMVNDGSTDSTRQIMMEYAGNDIRFRYVEQNNRGLSEARNTGMEHACGEYIAFVDSDDLLPADALMVMCEKARSEGADMVAGNVMVFDQVKEYAYTGRNRDSRGSLSGGDFLWDALKCHRYTPMVYGYLYRRKFIEWHALRFFPGILHEDELWTPMALARAMHVASVSDTTYYYRQHELSIMRQTLPERRIASLECIIHELTKNMNSKLWSDKVRQAFEERIQLLRQIIESMKY